MVGPTNRNPQRFSALLIASETGVAAGTSSRRRHALTTGAPPASSQRKSENPTPASRRSSQARALPMAARTLRRLRTIPASSISEANFDSS